MRIKKFIAASLQEGKAKILRELGDDAVILSSRTIRKGESSDNDVVEIVAAMDDSPVQASSRASASPIEKYGFHEHKDTPDSHHGDTNQSNTPAFHMQEEFSYLKEKINEIHDSLKYKYSGILGATAGYVYKELRKYGYSEKFAMSIIGRLNLKDSQAIPEAIDKARSFIIRDIQFFPTLQKSDKRKVLSFIGPSGSGKTTSLVKIAIIAKLVLEANPLIISADVHKVGGAEQLQTISSIAGISFRSVFTPADLTAALDEEKNRDFIFIDTTGRSQKNREHIDEIWEFLQAAGSDAVYLVQSLTSSSHNFADVMNEYERLNPNALVLSKYDESSIIGEIFELLNKRSLPIAYITTGQQIPNDIEPAEPELLEKMALPDQINNMEIQTV